MIDRAGVPEPRAWETMNMFDRLQACLIWHPARTVRCPQYKVDGNVLYVICPCVFGKMRKDSMDAAFDGNIPAVEIPPLSPLKLSRHEHYSMNLNVFIGQCPDCHRFVYMPVGALSDKERSI